MSDVRIPEVRRVLDEAGFASATVTVRGHDRSIAVLGDIAPEQLPALAAIAGAIKASGFQYVTLDITDLPS